MLNQRCSTRSMAFKHSHCKTSSHSIIAIIISIIINGVITAICSADVRLDFYCGHFLQTYVTQQVFGTKPCQIYLQQALSDMDDNILITGWHSCKNAAYTKLKLVYDISKLGLKLPLQSNIHE